MNQQLNEEKKKEEEKKIKQKKKNNCSIAYMNFAVLTEIEFCEKAIKWTNSVRSSHSMQIHSHGQVQASSHALSNHKCTILAQHMENFCTIFQCSSTNKTYLGIYCGRSWESCARPIRLRLFFFLCSHKRHWICCALIPISVNFSQCQWKSIQI